MQWLVKLIWNYNSLSHVPPGKGMGSYPRRTDAGPEGLELARQHTAK